MCDETVSSRRMRFYDSKYVSQYKHHRATRRIVSIFYLYRRKVYIDRITYTRPIKSSTRDPFAQHLPVYGVFELVKNARGGYKFRIKIK